MDRLSIALLIDAQVPVAKYGGTERQVVWLARELVRQGHEVTLIARPGSFIPGVRMIFARDEDEAFSSVPKDVMIVNAHGPVAPEGFKTPVLHTCHGISPSQVRGNWNFVSRSHAELHGRKSFAYNGLPPEEHYYRAEKNDRLLFFARINRPGKGISTAIELCRRHQRPLDIAGGVRTDLLTRSQVRKEGAFFRSLHPLFKFHGMVGGWQKAKLFAESGALLFPIRWPEPFGLVVVEALLAGTPVITTRNGAMPELVDQEVGFICETEDDYRHALENVRDIRPRTCREYAVEHFSIERSANQYLQLYRRVLDGEELP